jgi:hypothetical protein
MFFRYLKKTKWIVTLLLLYSPLVYGKGDREFTPTPGAITADSLSRTFRARVLEIQYRIRDAYDGAVYHTKYEKMAFDLGNAIHYESRTSTIQRRLLFQQGEWVDRDVLLETERTLREENFLADAIIEVRHLGEQDVRVIVHTYDRFSLAAAIDLKKPGDEWLFTAGISDGNFLGTGQELGFFYVSEIERSFWTGQYINKAFLQRNTRLGLEAAYADDGYRFAYFLDRPLVSKKQKWAAGISGKNEKRNYFYYLDANLPGALAFLVDSNQNKLYVYPGIVDNNIDASITRSFGYKHKLDVRSGFVWRERYAESSLEPRVGSVFLGTPFDIAGGDVPQELQLEFRKDYMVGVKLSYYWRDYKTVHNFRRLKWSEDLDIGFRLDQSIYQNLKLLGANNSDIYLEHRASYVNVWNNKHFLTTKGNLNYFLNKNGWNNGWLSSYMEYYWKPISFTATYLYGGWDHYFRQEKSAQLLLGGEEGLSGYPNRFFAGQARVFGQLEQRYFPTLEVLTYAPVFAAFITAGNTFPTYRDFSWGDLHYSAGVGLRIGATRAIQEVVNHINISFPIDSKYRNALSYWKLTILAKKSL